MARVTTGRTQEGGRLAVHKQDFNAHVSGDDFRQAATTVDMSPVIPNVGGSTVQAALENLTDIITSAGSGFVSIGSDDGYASGTYNVGTLTTPTFVDAFNAALADERLTNGGVILVMAGTYTITSSITIKPGITVLGELGGTYLIGETNEQSMFIVQSSTKDLTLGGDSGSGDTDIAAGSNADKVKFQNIILFDNLNGTASSGTSTMITVPMIALRQGGNLECDHVSFFGRLNDGSITNRSKTQSAIGTISGVSSATSLVVNSCFFDGLRNGIVFNPQAGDLDFLSVTNCRGRFFGKEAASYSATEDSFITASLCVANVCNNHITSGHSNAKTLIQFGTTGGTTSSIRVVVCGNYGNLNVASPFLIDNDSGVTFNSSIANNNWGVNTGSPWYIVIGGADGDSPVGDIYGPNAVNTIISWGNALGLEATVIVNPGTYTVTLTSFATSNVANLKFIGNKKGRSYPIFQLGIASSSIDNIGNRFVVLGNHLESIYFTSTSTFQSVRPSFNPLGISSQNAAHTITIKDCIFVNTALNFLTISGSSLDQLGNTTSTLIEIERCHFDQTGSFADNLSLVTAGAHIVHVKDCYFKGNGYAFNIGTEAAGAVTGIYGNYILENITVDKSSGITASAPGSLTTDKACIIKDTNAKVSLINFEIFCDRENTTNNPIGSSLLTTGSFTSFVYLEADEINILNSFFNGPNAYFISGGINYALPCVQLTASTSFTISNSKFHSGGIPLQVKSTLSSTRKGGMLSISNSSFHGVTDDPPVTLTMLDVDIERTGTFEDNPLQLHISGCSFLHSPTVEAAYAVLHSNVTGASYDAHGIVQLYCRGIDVNFSNNKVWGILYAPIVNPYTHLSALAINTYSSDAGNVTWHTSSTIANNEIAVQDNNYSIASASASASCMFLRTSIANVTGNNFNFSNAAAVLASFAGCLVFDIRSVSGLGSANVHNNYLANHSSSGFFTPLSRGYITILSTTTIRGMITNNAFESLSIDFSVNTSLVEDNTTSARRWLVVNNRNQTVTVSVNGTIGKMGIRDTGTTVYTEVGDVPSVTSSDAAFIWSTSNAVVFRYSDTGNEEMFLWTIPLYTLLPHGAYVDSISCGVDVSSTPSVGSIATLSYRDTTGTSTDTANPLTTAGDTLSLSFTTNQRPVLPELLPVVELTWQVNGASSSTLTAEVMTITYRW